MCGISTVPCYFLFTSVYIEHLWLARLTAAAASVTLHEMHYNFPIYSNQSSQQAKLFPETRSFTGKVHSVPIKNVATASIIILHSTGQWVAPCVSYLPII